MQQFSFQKLTRSTSNGSSGFSEDSSLPSPISENGNADIAFPQPVFTRIGGTFRVEHHDESGKRFLFRYQNFFYAFCFFLDSNSFASAAFEKFSSQALRLAIELDTKPASSSTASSVPAIEGQSSDIRFDELAATGSFLPVEKIELRDLIGRGSFAVVYCGNYGGKKVAVKQFRDYDEFTLAMFCDEVAIMRYSKIR